MDIINQIFSNGVLIITFSAWLISCILKGLIVCIRQRRLDITRFWGPGGMPSSHSALVSSLSIAVGNYYGFDNPMFAITCALALVVMYDASGIRRAAGKQAQLINQLIEGWDEADELLKQTKLKELLGHTPVEVLAGALLGIIVAVLFNMGLPAGSNEAAFSLMNNPLFA